MNWSTAGTTKPWVMPCCWNNLTVDTGSKSRTMTEVQPSYIPATAQPPPPMWNSGMATRFIESGLSSQMVLAAGRRLKKLRFDSITPFGRPVVPDE